jgi:hypothetical protein
MNHRDRSTIVTYNRHNMFILQATGVWLTSYDLTRVKCLSGATTFSTAAHTITTLSIQHS